MEIFENRPRAVFCCSPLIKASDTHYYLLGPPGGVACHGAGAARKTASFSDLRSSSSFAQVIDLIRGYFAQMSNRLKSVHHHGPGNCRFKTEHQPTGRDYWRTPSDGRRQAEKY
ncbi:hypothetical protein DNU99_11325 [Salmonella enterica subsp. enterica serovar Corvallis]|nr:hypothetical protein [Salmonella enterica subsp. enterica serovar Newport]EBR0248395.1 hypothetical protein [Salmonella enterica subsp. enterica serovar Corvallis]ECJ9728407.1 hypothetical protein [Salmonella enterica]